MTGSKRALEPSEAVRTADKMGRHVERLAAEVTAAALQAKADWEGLGRANGQREDHAAALLSVVRCRLGTLVDYAARCRDQIAQLQADPFGEDQ